MRHLKSGRALSVKPPHRRAMMRNMVTSLLEHEKITTTLARAKELRKPLDKMITCGKKGDLASRRRALQFVKSKLAMKNLFGDFAERYKDRGGGYSRIITLGNRRGDGALMAMIVLVDSPKDPFAGETKPKRRRRGGTAKAKPVLEQVAEEVSKPDTSEAPAEAPASDSSESATAKASAPEAEEESAPDEAESTKAK